MTTKTIAVAAVLLLTLSPAAFAQGKASKGGATTSKEIYSQAHFELLLKERTSMGVPDTPDLRNAIRDELINRELIVREAKKKGSDKDPNMKAQMELAAQGVLVGTYIREYVRANPVSDEALKKDYEGIKTQVGDKEYKVRHILVEKEDEAKEIITLLQKGEKFEKLADRSKDTGSKANGGDLDWNTPNNFVKPFSDAMTALEKGKFTPKPIQSQFGWHVIQLDDTRAAKIPSFDEVKQNLQQRAQNQVVENLIRELRTKNGMK